MIPEPLAKALEDLTEYLRKQKEPISPSRVIKRLTRGVVRDIDLREAVWILIGRGTIVLTQDQKLEYVRQDQSGRNPDDPAGSPGEKRGPGRTRHHPGPVPVGRRGRLRTETRWDQHDSPEKGTRCCSSSGVSGSRALSSRCSGISQAMPGTPAEPKYR